MSGLLKRFLAHFPNSKLLCLEREALNLLKARRLAEKGYFRSEGEKELEFLNLMGDAEEGLNRVVDKLLEIEGK